MCACGRARVCACFRDSSSFFPLFLTLFFLCACSHVARSLSLWAQTGVEEKKKASPDRENLKWVFVTCATTTATTMTTMTMSMISAMCDPDTISLWPMGGRMQPSPTPMSTVTQQQQQMTAAKSTATPQSIDTEAAPTVDDHCDTDAHQLHRRWAWWVHRPCYEGSSYAGTWEPMAKTHVSTVESFWRHQNNLPSPGALFGANRERVRNGDESAIEGISFFESGVLPEWEHVRNAMGASVVFKGTFGPRHASAVWERVVMALVGEQIGDDSERITGARMVDRISSMRVEVWLDDDDPQLADRVGRWFLAHAFDGVVAPGAVRDFFVSPHVQAKSAKGEGYRAAPHARRLPASATRRAPAPDGTPRSGRGSGGGDRTRGRPSHETRIASTRVF